MEPSQTEVPARESSSPGSLAGHALWLSFAAATTGTFMVNVDSSVVNVALPVMQHQFSLPIAGLEWVVSAYLLVITGILPVAGQLADRLGRKDVFVWGIGVFTLGSLLCAFSPNIGWLIGARIFQALGGATIMANVMAIIALIFPFNKRGQALGLIGSVVAAGTLMGPPLGGILTALWGWRSIFLINIPLGIWGIWGSLRYLPKFPRDPVLRGAPLDWAGALMFFATTSLLEFGLTDIHRLIGWIMLTVMMITLGLFVRRESRDGALVPVRLFKVAAFSSNMVAGLAYWILMMFPSFLLPFYLRTELHLPVGLIGLSLMPQALAMIVVSPYGGRWMDRVGILLPARSGMAILGVADVATALWPGIIPLWGVWVLLGLQGIAAGIFSSPNSAAILGSVEKRDTGLASSLLATQRNLGRALGVALASALLTLVWTFHGLGPTPSHHSTLYPMWFRWGFRGAFWVGAGFAIVGVITTRRPDVMRRGSH